MNNKGFTLIELLAVIVILAGISLTTVMGISASLERRDIKECKEQIEIAKNAAKIYFSLLDKNNNIEPVTVGKLMDDNYFDDNKINRLSDSDTIDIYGVFNGTDCSEE